MILNCVFNDSEMLFNGFYFVVYKFEKLLNGFEMFFNDLSRRSKNFERDTYKGGRWPKAAAPFVGLLSQ